MTIRKSAQSLRQRGRRIRRRDFLPLLAGATIAPRALRAQQKAMPVVGFLSGARPSRCTVCGRAPPGTSPNRLRRGANVAIEYRWAGVTMIGCPHWLPISLAIRSM